MEVWNKLNENAHKIGDKIKAGEKDHNPGINCEVSNCQFHDESSQCCANKIKVGPTFASSSTETVCSTFKPR